MQQRSTEQHYNCWFETSSNEVQNVSLSPSAILRQPV